MTKQQKKIKIEWALKIFRTAVLVYADYLGLKDWEWIIDTSEERDREAHFMTQPIGRLAEVYLSKPWIIDKNPTPDQIKLAAFHEVTEVLLSGLRKMADTTFNYDKADEEIHKVIRVLENTLFKEINKNAKDN